KKGHHAGYIADFTFGDSYKYFALGFSTAAFIQGDGDEPPGRPLLAEFSAVGLLSTTPAAAGPAPGSVPVPEPASWVMLLSGIGAMGLSARRGRALRAAWAIAARPVR